MTVRFGRGMLGDEGRVLGREAPYALLDTGHSHENTRTIGDGPPSTVAACGERPLKRNRFALGIGKTRAGAARQYNRGGAEQYKESGRAADR
jgi:hypothetical protein